MPKRSKKSNHGPKRQKIEKSLDALLSEVFSSEFEDFRAYLEQEQIKYLVLYNRNLGMQPLNLLGEALKGTSVTTVDLGKNQMGTAEAKDFAAGLNGTSVTTVDLSHNQIVDAGAKDFAAGLKDTKVTTVNLLGNQIGYTGAKDFAAGLKGTSVTTVDLSHNQIDDAGAKDFAAGLKGTSVTTVNLWNNQIGPAGAKDFAVGLKDTKVITVNLGNNRIGDAGANNFAAGLKDTSVTTVNLGNNRISDDGARDFAEELKDTKVTTVDLEGNQIGDTGAKDFAAGLKGTSVTTVSFGHNRIGDEGARSLLAVIPETNLTKIELHYNNITSDILVEIKNALDKNIVRLMILKEVPIMLMAMTAAPGANPEPLSDKKYETCQNPSEQLMYAAQILHALPPEISQSIVAEAMRQSPAAILANYDNFAAQRAKAGRKMLEVLLEPPAAQQVNGSDADRMEVDNDKGFPDPTIQSPRCKTSSEFSL